jgi:hypothetical protein
MSSCMHSWFAFGPHGFLGSKSMIQAGLAISAPQTARIGRELSASIPNEPTLRGAPVFRLGSGSSDVLHALLERRETPFRLLVGQSTGALQIGNAIESLVPECRRGTMRCHAGLSDRQERRGRGLPSVSALFDALGQLSAWGIGLITDG